MSEYTSKVYERMYPLLSLHPANKTAAAHVTGFVSLRDYHRVWVVLNVGVIAATTVIDLNLQQATTTAGAGSKALTPAKAITQLTDTDDDCLVCIELQTEELDVSGGFDCIQATLTLTNSTAYCSLIVYGVEPRFMAVPTTAWQEMVG